MHANNLPVHFSAWLSGIGLSIIGKQKHIKFPSHLLLFRVLLSFMTESKSSLRTLEREEKNEVSKMYLAMMTTQLQTRTKNGKSRSLIV